MTLIAAAGWAIPPFLVLTGQHHLSASYEKAAIPRDWAIAVSDNGWATNKRGVEWLKHFDAHTHRLLTLDGRESRNSLEFCKESN